MNHQTWRSCVAGLGEVDHGASPSRVGLGPEPGLRVVGRLHPVAGTAALHRPQPGAAVLAVLRPLEVPRPHAAQCLHHRQRRCGRRRVRLGQRVKQEEPIRPDPCHKGIALWAGLGQPHVLDPHVVALVPLGRRKRAQPVRRDDGDVVQRRAQRLGHELHAVEQCAEPVAQDQVGIAGTKGGAGDTGGVLGHGRDRLLRAKRHGHFLN